MSESKQPLPKPDSDDVESRVIGDNQVPSRDNERDPESPITGFVPTLTEMKVLARHWAKEELDFPLSYFVRAQTDSYSRYLWAYASGRLAKIQAQLGDKFADDIRLHVYDRSRHELGERGWDIFMNGSDEEKRRYQQEMWRSDGPDFDRVPPQYAVCEMFDLAMARLPEVPAKEVARALREAAGHVEQACSRPTCEHVWKQEDPDSPPQRFPDGSTRWCERCEICAAIRECRAPTPKPDATDNVDS